MAQIKLFDLFPGPRRISQKFQTGFDAGFVVETLDLDLLAELFPAVMPNQLGQDGFQSDTV